MTDLTDMPSGPNLGLQRGRAAVPLSALRHGRPARGIMAERLAPNEQLPEEPYRARGVQVAAAICLLLVAILTTVLLEPQWRGKSMLPASVIKLVQGVPVLGPWFMAGLEGHGAAKAATTAAELPPPSVSPEELLPESLLDLTPEQAREINLAMPISKIKSAVAQPFLLPHTDLEVRRRAVQCLTAAIYYEAAQEPVAGQRGVAQVIINRMRHPAYPKTICGVIFQGSERKTGCQFTFTCDGALARLPNPVLWRRAQDVAEAALNGSVDRSVGLSTHYHANYVVPRWASSLTKTAVQGAHIFYRWTGGWGTPAAFTGRWATAEEDIPGLPPIEMDAPTLILASTEPAIEPSSLATAATEAAEPALAIAPAPQPVIVPQHIGTDASAPAVITNPQPAIKAPPAAATPKRAPRLAVPSRW